MASHGFEPIYSTAVAAGRALLSVFRFRRQVAGLEHVPTEGGAILAITHFGYLDFALTEWVVWHGNRRKIRFMAKESVFKKPVLGWLLRGMRHIPVNMKAGAAAFDAAVDALKSGELLGVFPEAGVSASFTVRELKTGAVRLAAQAGVPIVPVAVWGGHRALTKNHKPTFRDAYKTLVSVQFGAPITVNPNDDPLALTKALQLKLQSMIDELQKNYPIDGTGAWWQPRHLGGTAPTPEESVAADAARDRRREAEAAAKAAKNDSAASE